MIQSFLNFLRYIFYSFEKKKFTLFSEGIFYKNYYYELAIELKKTNNLVIVTSDAAEFNDLKNDFKVFLISNEIIKLFFFTFVNCEYLIMTMNDIGNNYVKSKFCKNFVYFFHSLASTHVIYNEKAYDNFDVIFVNGKYQEDEIRYREKLKNLKKKQILNTGYFFLNYLRNKPPLLKKNNKLLFAPSWNKSKNNFFENISEEIIYKLVKSDKDIIFRPHPELIKRNQKKYNEIVDKFNNYKNFKVDLSEDNKYLNNCNYLITDNSTIALEFSLINFRPSIYFNFEPKIHNINYKDIPLKSYEDSFKEKFAISINDINDLNNLDVLCNEFMISKNTYENELKSFEKETLYDCKNSVHIACNFLQKR